MFYVEAHPRSGRGHLGRCAGLAQACQRAGIPVFFLLRKGTPSARIWLARQGIPASRTALARHPRDLELWLRRHHPRVMVIDGLTFLPREKSIFKELHRTTRLLQLDDRHRPLPEADLVVRPQDWPNRLHRLGNIQWLVGPRFAPLRREFLHRKFRPARPTATRLLLSLGASTGVQRTLGRLERALRPLADTVTVLSGAKRRAASHMSQTDLAVTAAGHTAYELAHLGVPMVALQTSALQASSLQTLVKSGAAWYGGRLSTLSITALVQHITRLMQDHPLRRKLALAGRRLVDGHGAERIIRAVAGYASLRKRHWRPAKLHDSKWLWQLRNAPRVRRAYIHTQPISSREHRAWLLRTLSDPDRHLFILLDERGGRIGQIRLDRHAGARAEITISLHSAARGKGYGRKGLEEIMAHGSRRLGFRSYFAQIKSWNKPSLRLFASLGFKIVRRKPMVLLIKQQEKG